MNKEDCEAVCNLIDKIKVVAIYAAVILSCVVIVVAGIWGPRGNADAGNENRFSVVEAEGNSYLVSQKTKKAVKIEVPFTSVMKGDQE